MKYICYYDLYGIHSENRNVSIAAVNKINYILSSLCKCINEDIVVVSPAETKNKCFCRGNLRKLKHNIYLKTFFSFGKKNFITKAIDYFFIPIYIFFFLIFNTRKNEIIFLYHSLKMIKPVLLAKKIKKFNLILELEELYSDITQKNSDKRHEMKICEKADGYIFPCYYLNRKLNYKKKPSIIIHGSYDVVNETKILKKLDKYIHIVYAGTLDSRKGGALAALSIAKFLPSNYHLHILGFGTDEEIRFIKEKIEILNQKNAMKISYDGVLSGEEYLNFLKNCSIGLSTQNPNGEYNNTSFPSKILSYLANNLYVVSAKLPVVYESDIGDIVFYYDKQFGEEIAKIIKSINVNKESEGYIRIKKLDEKFVKELNILLNKFNNI